MEGERWAIGFYNSYGLGAWREEGCYGTRQDRFIGKRVVVVVVINSKT